MLESAQSDIAKWERINLERLNFIDNLDLQNKGHRGHVVSLTEELGAARESVRASDGRIIDLEEEVM